MRIGLHAYLVSREIGIHGYPWHALLCELMRTADSTNTALLASVFPDEYNELLARYNAPGGRIGAESLVEISPDPTTSSAA